MTVSSAYLYIIIQIITICQVCAAIKKPPVSWRFHGCKNYPPIVSPLKISKTRLVIVQAKKITTIPMMALMMIFFPASFPSSSSPDVRIFHPPQRAIPTMMRPRRPRRFRTNVWIVSIGSPVFGHLRPSSTRSMPGSISARVTCTIEIAATPVYIRRLTAFIKNFIEVITKSVYTMYFIDANLSCRQKMIIQSYLGIELAGATSNTPKEECES